MKTLAVICMLLMVLLILLAGMLYFFGFIMSFDAPGSATDPAAWRGRFMMFLPVILSIVVLVLAAYAFRHGYYGRSVILSAFSVFLAAAFWVWLLINSTASLRKFQTQIAEEKALAERFPKETFLRHREGGTDTIIVWPDGIVAYRLFIPVLEKPWSGPLGDLTAARDTFRYYAHTDTRLRKEELHEFLNASNRRFSEVFIVE